MTHTLSASAVNNIKKKPTVYARQAAWQLHNQTRAFDLLLFYVLATYKVISGQGPTCHSAHSWRLYSAARLDDQTTNTMI